MKFAAFRNKPLADLKASWYLFGGRSIYMKLFQGKPTFRSHASRIFNVFDSVIDCLDKDPDNTEIQKIIADGKIVTG